MASPVIEFLRILFRFVLRSVSVLFEWLFRVLEFLAVCDRNHLHPQIHSIQN